MSNIPSHHKIALASIKCFSDDGKLDEGELGFIMGLALADNVIDDDEKRILRSLFSKLSPGTVNSKVIERINEIKKKHSI